MYTIYRSDTYKLALKSLLSVLLFLSFWLSWKVTLILLLGWSGLYALSCWKKGYVVFKTDENGIFLCGKKDKVFFIPWERIRFVIFVVGNVHESKILIRQLNNETHQLWLGGYFYFTPKSAINAVCKYADNKSKVKITEMKLYSDEYYIEKILEEERKEKRRKEIERDQDFKKRKKK